MSVKALVEPERTIQMLVSRSWDGVEKAKALAFEKPGLQFQLAI